MQYPKRCETGNHKGKGHHLLDSKTTAARPSEARGKEPSQPLSPRKMLVTGRRKEGCQVPKRSSHTHIRELDQGWRQVKSMQRQSFSAFHKSLLETRKDSARLREVHSRARVHSFRDVSFRDVYFISETCLFAKAKVHGFLPLSLSLQLGQHRPGHAKCPEMFCHIRYMATLLPAPLSCGV